VKLVDLNVLLYAINREAEHHLPCRSWLEEALAGEEPVGFAWVVLLGFLRVATRLRIFPTAISPEAAIRVVDAWLAAPNTRVVTESPDEHWRLLRQLLAEVGTAGNLTTDAHLAALAIENGATLVSCDADFARFRGVRWENPAARRDD
jgi:toxin-antitoxin system PIN domain toxin